MDGIKILSEKVASQIAAGEVIDRPASVVRELLDNSIDAGADRISVVIEKGGKTLIRVRDNGVGMSRDDLLLSVERHATSKIQTAEDLFSIKSMGFRGEALPAIGSVSRLEITSRLHDQLAGHRLKMSGGKLLSMEESGAPPGTIAEVRDLFYNVPARRKFLRSDSTEVRHILDICSRIGLPFSHISFTLRDGEKELLSLPASEQDENRLAALLGRRVAGAMVAVDETTQDLAIRGYLAPPELSRARGDRLFVYVNGRNIRDRLATKAIIEAYGERLMKGQYPQAVLFMALPPAGVDVNVHPAKLEVRFRDTQRVFQGIVRILAGALRRVFQVPTATEGEQRWAPPPRESTGLVSEPFQESMEWPRTGPFPPDGTGREPEAGKRVYVLGQLGKTYVLCEVEDGFLLVDQHAAHERIVYDRLKEGLAGAGLEVQTLLVPHSLELAAREGRVATEKAEEFRRLGIELEHFGGNSFLLRSVPAILRNVDWDAFVSELIGELEGGRLTQEDLAHRAVTVMACHGSIRAGEKLSFEEMTRLISQLEEAALPTNCPHGRPIFKHFTYPELEKIFRRRI